MITGPRLLAIALLLTWSLFCLWYLPSGGPLTNAELEGYLQQVRARANGPVDETLLEELRTLAASDDGGAFVNVNLIRYRDKAAYPPGSGYSDDPLAADARYTRAIMPALLRHGAFPLWVGDVTGAFLEPEAARHWDRVALVRYRSRRDLLEMVVALASQPIAIHKWASIETTHVFPARSRISLASVPLLAAVLLALTGLLLHLLLRRLPAYRRRGE